FFSGNASFGSPKFPFLQFFKVGHGNKYVPLHERINRRIKDGTPFFSLEFFPPKTANGVANFFTRHVYCFLKLFLKSLLRFRLDRFNEGGPLFVDITWHLGSDPGRNLGIHYMLRLEIQYHFFLVVCEKSAKSVLKVPLSANMTKETSSSSIAAGCLDYCRVDTMLHMTCAQYSKEQTIKHLEQSKSVGLRNILALRGDLPNIERDDAPIYKYRALDMIRWIREEFADYFTIGCSGEIICNYFMRIVIFSLEFSFLFLCIIFF
ncbi:unnamed protein product, partial [Strongylus vulgaris]